MLYRKEIDGLRSLAVVPVILFHAGSQWFSGGFVGVDIFFVISGYLIATKLTEDIDNQRFSLWDFYERRVRRIIPALLVVLLVSIFFARLVLLPADIKVFSKSLLATLFFYSNIYFYKQSGYFDVSGELKPLLHTWSLSLEEQFYIVFPLLIYLLLSRSRKATFGIFLLLALISLGYAQSIVGKQQDFAFYMLQARAWEFLIGVLVSLSTFKHWAAQRPAKLRAGLALSGLLLILGSIFFIDRTQPFPGLLALPATLGAGLLIAFASSENTAGKFLSSPPLVGIGLISYSAYLWHQPIFAIARHWSLDELPGLAFIPLIALTFILAFLSWRYIERPFRNKAFLTRRALFTLAFAAAFVTIGIAYAAYTTSRDGLAIERESTGGKCNFDDKKCYELPEATQRLALWGDSYADAFAMRLGDALNQHAISLALYIKHNCPSIPGTRRNDPERVGNHFIEECLRHNEDAERDILARKPDYVVLTSNYEGAFYTPNKWGESSLKDLEEVAASPEAFIPKRLSALTRRLNAQNIIPIIITPYPHPTNFEQIKKSIYRRLPVHQAIDIERASSMREKIITQLEGDRVHYREIDGRSLYCQGNACDIIDTQGRFLLHDGSHMSPVLGEILSEKILQIIRQDRHP